MSGTVWPLHPQSAFTSPSYRVHTPSLLNDLDENNFSDTDPTAPVSSFRTFTYLTIVTPILSEGLILLAKPRLSKPCGPLPPHLTTPYPLLRTFGCCIHSRGGW